MTEVSQNPTVCPSLNLIILPFWHAKKISPMLFEKGEYILASACVITSTFADPFILADYTTKLLFERPGLRFINDKLI